MDNRMVSGSSSLSESGFLSRVYLWMAGGLALSTGGAVWLLSQPDLLKMLYTNTALMFGLVIAEVVLVVALSAMIQRISAGTAALMFAGYSFLNGLTLASVFIVYTGESIARTLLVTAGTFLFFSVYGATTKKDLTSIGQLAMMGLFGMIIASLVNIFLKSTALMWVSTFVGIAVFLGLIAYDTQKLKAIYAHGVTDEESRGKLAIIGALALYLDFINLFILLLRIFGRRRD